MAVCGIYFSIEVFGVDWKWARETFTRQQGAMPDSEKSSS